MSGATTAERLVITSAGDSYFNGNLGIGATSPGAKLEIGTAGATAKPDALRISNASDYTYYWDIWRDNTTGYLNFGSATGGSLTTQVTIKDVTGNVGIGTTTPYNPLSVIDDNSYSYYTSTSPYRTATFQGDGNTSILVAADGNAAGVYSEIRLGNAHDYYGNYSPYIRGTQGSGIDSYSLEFGTSQSGVASTVMYIGGASGTVKGNVGIGTTSPNYKLSVANASTRIVSINYQDSINTIMSHAGSPNYGLESLSIRGDNIYFYTDYDATHYQGVEKMRLTNYGQLLINAQSSSYGNNAWGYNLGIMGDATQAYMSMNYNGAALDSLGVIFGVDATGGQWYHRENKSLNLHTNNTLRMTIQGGGDAIFNNNVGIGTTTPQQPLHVKSTGDLFTRYQANSNANGVQFQTWHGNSQTMTINSNTTNPFAVYVGSASGTIAINVDSNANVGIGTTLSGAQNEKLFVDGTVRQQSTIGTADNVRNGLGAYDNTTGWAAGIGGQLVLGYIYTGPYYTEGAIIKMYKENSTQGNYGSGLKFQVRNHGANLSTKLTLDPSGNLTATGDVTAYSDERLKSNIKTLDGSKVYNMRGVSFDKDGKKGSGVIAQELEKIAPELVHNEQEYKAVAYGNLTGYLIEAIKELEARVKELENK